MKKKHTALIMLFAVVTSLLQAGCLAPQGIIYTRVTQPHSLPSYHHACPLATKRCYVSLTQLKEPVTRMNLSVMWSNSEVRKAARAAGIQEIYYTDIETLSILMGTYKRNRIIFYGN
ncbi:MAG: TRL domain-containing protein [Kiritimatiellae bacterium]|nr:TRL domain-containing protein [Kiritimatiellia bacterium]